MSKYVPVKLAYNTFVPTSGVDTKLSPVIFMHGVTGCKEMWEDIPQIVADRTKRKAYAIDARNHGDSEWSDVFDFDINAVDLLHFMDTISAQKAVLVGHSMGGKTSIGAALTNPDRVEMIFIEDMVAKKVLQESYDGVLTYVEKWKKALDKVPADCDEADVSRTIVEYMMENDTESDLENWQILYSMKSPVKKNAEGRYVFKTNLKVVTNAMRNGENCMRDPQGSYEGPASFIYGTESKLKVHEDEEAVRKHFPNAKLIPMEGADHCVHAQFPAEFTDIVLDRILKYQKSDKKIEQV